MCSLSVSVLKATSQSPKCSSSGIYAEDERSFRFKHHLQKHPPTSLVIMSNVCIIAKGGVGGGGGGDLIQTFCETDHSLFGYVTFIINAHPKSHESY